MGCDSRRSLSLFSFKMMRDPINPTRDRIRMWAFTEDAMKPEQVWELFLSSSREIDLTLNLPPMTTVRQRTTLSKFSVKTIGDAVRTNSMKESEGSIREIHKMTEKFPRYRFHLLRQRSEEFLDNPSTFIYDDWCAGSLSARA